MKRSELPIDDIVAAYQSGLTAKAVATRFGCLFTQVYYVLEKMKIPRRPSGRTHFEVPVPEILRLSRAGSSLRTIAEPLGISHELVRLTLQRAKAKKKRRSP